jgi:hypothetical protein
LWYLFRIVGYAAINIARSSTIAVQDITNVSTDIALDAFTGRLIEYATDAMNHTTAAVAAPLCTPPKW